MIFIMKYRQVASYVATYIVIAFLQILYTLVSNIYLLKQLMSWGSEHTFVLLDRRLFLNGDIHYAIICCVDVVLEISID